MAVGAVVGGTSAAIGGSGVAGRLLSGSAGAITGAATRSLLTGSDFGDTLMRALPDAIGSTIGGIVAEGLTAGARARPALAPLEGSPVAEVLGDGSAVPQTGEDGGQVGGVSSQRDPDQAVSGKRQSIAASNSAASAAIGEVTGIDATHSGDGGLSQFEGGVYDGQQRPYEISSRPEMFRGPDGEWGHYETSGAKSTFVKGFYAPPLDAAVLANLAQFDREAFDIGTLGLRIGLSAASAPAAVVLTGIEWGAGRISDLEALLSVAPLGRALVRPGAIGRAAENAGAGLRPSWRASEIDVGASIEGQGYRPQVSFMGGKEVRYGTKGSVRPEYYGPGSSIEVKNYNVETPRGRASLVRNISNQAVDRASNLPAGTTQNVYIDVRGQSVSRTDLNAMVNRIVQRSNGAVQPGNINIVR